MAQPKLRFKSEDGTEFPEWKTQKLSSVSSRVVRKNVGNISDIPLTIASLYGLVDQREYFKKTIASQNMEGYYLLYNGEFAYNKSYSKGFDFGAIKRLDKYEYGALSTLYICFALKKSVDSDFMVQYFDSQKWSKEVSIRCAEGARNHGLLNISTDDFFDIEMLLSEALEEQQKIADFLSTVDEVITQSEAEVQNLEQQKKAAMQKIFSQEVRFRREDATNYPNWDEYLLQDISFYVTATAVGNKASFIGTENMKKGCMGVLFDTDGNSEVQGVKYQANDILVSNIRPYLQKAWKADRNGICSTDVLCIRGNNGIDSNFLYDIIANDKFFDYVMQGAKGTKMPRGDKRHIMDMPVAIPCLEEQQKIADFLSAYDEAISYAKQELDKWKELKKGLLQQMFV